MSTGQGVSALVADGAVIGDVAELVECFRRDAAPRLLLVEEGLDQQRGGEDLVARAVEQVGARHVGGAHRLALAAAQAVLDRIGDRCRCRTARMISDSCPEQAEARRVGVAQVAAREQLAALNRPSRVDRLLVAAEGRDFIRRSRYSSLVMPMPCSPEITPSSDRARRMMRATAALAVCSIVVVVGVDRDVGVHIAVAGMHVQRHEHARLEHALVNRVAAARGCGGIPGRRTIAAIRRALRPSRTRARCGPAAPRTRSVPRASRRRVPGTASGARLGHRQVEVLEQIAPARAHPGDEFARRPRAGRRATRARAGFRRAG